MRRMPHTPRFFQRAPSEARAGQPLVSGVPCLLGRSNRAKRTVHSKFPQSGTEVPSLHHVPHGDPRFEHRSVLVQALKEAAMRATTRTQNFHFRETQASTCLLLTAALLLLLPVAAGAQQEEEQKGVDQGNYNIKQSIEFGGRFTNLSGDF